MLQREPKYVDNGSGGSVERRELLKTILAAGAIPAANAVAQSTAGMAPLTIKDVKIITTSGGRNYRWVFLKIITSEPGLYGIGTAGNHYQTQAVITALEQHLKP